MSAQPLNTYTVTDYTSSKGGEIVADNISGKTVRYVFAYNDLPAPVNSTGTRQVIIPANSGIEKAELKIVTTFNGTTPSITAGLQQADGTEIDNDGFIAAETSVTAGDYTIGAGALVGAQTGAADGQVVVTLGGSGTTTGVAELYITYK